MVSHHSLSLSASLSSHCSGKGTQQLLSKAGSLLAQWMWFLHSFWWTLASLRLSSLTDLLLVSPGRLSACPTRKSRNLPWWPEWGSHVSHLPCLYYRLHQPFSFSHGRLCLSDHSSLCAYSHICHLNNSGEKPVSSAVLTTSARPLASFCLASSIASV